MEYSVSSKWLIRGSLVPLLPWGWDQVWHQLFCLISPCLGSAFWLLCLLPVTSVWRDAKGLHLISLTKMSLVLSYTCAVQIRASHVKQSAPLTSGLPAYGFISNSAKLGSLSQRWQSQSKPLAPEVTESLSTVWDCDSLKKWSHQQGGKKASFLLLSISNLICFCLNFP